MAAPMDSDDEDTFVTLGTPFPDVDDDAPARKPVSFQDLAVKDSKGRTRFHGAFTGGFSAGHFNTVGSKEGFTPSTFVSSRDKKSVDHQQFKPEDFMDDDDFGEYGIAPKKLVTADTYSSEERRKRRLDQAKSLTSGTIISGEPALADLILPERLTVGIKLLRKLGWKEGQGLGPRERRTKKPSKKKPVMKIYGCAPPPEGSGDDSSEEDLPSDVTFAPKDTNPVSLVAKDNVHGLGYSGLDPRSALPSTHINLFAPPPISKSGRKGITGQAFGIGALEEDDEDIYATDHMSNYDVTMEIDDGSERLFGWTAPGRNQNRNQNIRADYIGKVLEGFSLSSKPLKQKKSFGPPVLPKNFTPVHRFMKFPQSAVSGSECRKEKLNSVSRGVILGDTPIINSVFDLIPKDSQEKLYTAKQSVEVTDGTKNLAVTLHSDSQSQTFSDKRTANKTIKPSRFSSSVIDLQDSELSSRNSTITPGGDMPDKSSSDQDLKMSNVNTSVTDKPAIQTPLFQGTDISFKPFAKDPPKQARYEKYIALIKLKKDAYDDVVEGHMTEWEREREKEEFIRASKLFKPMSNAMASRFTSAKHSDNADKYVDVPAEEEGDQDDKSNAAKIKMYGRLTRDTFEWHPDRLLCQRFNVPDPYPSSSITGLPTIKRDKYSVFNFLDLSTKQLEQADVKSAAEVSPSSDAGSNTVKKSAFHMTIQAHKPPPMKSIFSVLMKEPPDNQTSMKQPTEGREVSPVDPTTASLQDQDSTETTKQDLFETIFGNTDSEDSSDDPDIAEQPKEKDNLPSNVVPLQETALTGSLNSPVKHKTAESNTSVVESLVSCESADRRPGLSQTAQSRLSPPSDSTANSVVENNMEAYGPSLPPKTVEQHSTRVLQITSRTEHKFSGGGDALSGSIGHDISDDTSSSSLRHRTGGGDTLSGSLRHRTGGGDTSSGSLRHRTDGGDTSHSSSLTKSKHKHKHKKDKKSKHKKDKKRKREKKEKKPKKYSSDDTDSSDDVPSDRQLLQIMKSVSGGRHQKEFT